MVVTTTRTKSKDFFFWLFPFLFARLLANWIGIDTMDGEDSIGHGRFIVCSSMCRERKTWKDWSWFDTVTYYCHVDGKGGTQRWDQCQAESSQEHRTVPQSSEENRPSTGRNRVVGRASCNDKSFTANTTRYIFDRLQLLPWTVSLSTLGPDLSCRKADWNRIQLFIGASKYKPMG